jgi:hypothetical protein
MRGHAPLAVELERKWVVEKLPLPVDTWHVIGGFGEMVLIQM